MSSLLFWIGLAVASIGAAVLSYGFIKEKKAPQWIGMVSLILSVCLFIILLAAPVTSTVSRRVVYSQNGEMVVIDDKDGSTEKLTLSDVPHREESYNIGDIVTIVYNGSCKPVYVTTDKVTPAGAETLPSTP